MLLLQLDRTNKLKYSIISLLNSLWGKDTLKKTRGGHEKHQMSGPWGRNLTSLEEKTKAPNN